MLVGSSDNDASPDEDICAVCIETLHGDETIAPTCLLPGCGHRLHVACALSCSQYDSRCPVCRAVPNGVHVRDNSSTRRVSDEIQIIGFARDARSVGNEPEDDDDDDVTVIIRLHDGVQGSSRQDHVITQTLPRVMHHRLLGEDEGQWEEVRLRREWERYTARRRRALQQRPDLHRMYMQIKELRSEQRRTYTHARTEYTRRCREVWRCDANVLQHRKTIERARRRELRLERRLCGELNELIGASPFEDR